MNTLMQFGLVGLAALLPLALAALVGYIRKLRPERELTLRLRAQARLPELDLGSKAGLLKMRWAGKPVESLVVSRWSLVNSGSQPIRRTDFDADLRIRFPKHNFLGASIYAGDPLELESRVRNALSNQKTGFALKPLLWNRKESADFTVVTKKPVTDVNQLDVDARIVSGRVRLVDDTGTDRERVLRQQRNIFLAMAYAGAVAAIVSLLLSVLLLR